MKERTRVWTLGLVVGGLAVVCLALLLVAPSLVRAGTLTVGPGETYTTVKGAISAASPGDTILVQTGTYPQALEITKSLTLKGGYDATFAEGNRDPRTSVISRTEVTGSGLEVVIDGFTVKDGSGNHGGGIYVDVEDDSKVVINDNSIHDNTAWGDGGAIWADLDNRCTLEITGNDIMTNTADSDGGGIYANIVMSGTLTLTGNDIVSNTADTDGGGFVIALKDYGLFQVADNVVMSNTATTASYGGLEFKAEYICQGTFDRNRVEGNEANQDYGGGYVYIGYDSHSTFAGNEFVGNVAGRYGGLELSVYHNSHLTGDALKVEDNEAGGSWGGGYVYVGYGGSASLPNTRIVGNEAAESFGGVEFEAEDYATIEVPNLYVYDNHADDGFAGGVHFDAYDSGETILARDAQFISNTCTEDGGGAYVATDQGALVDLTGSQFENNQAGTGPGHDGGGLYVDAVESGSEVRLDDAKFISNTSGNKGGGLYVADCTEGCEFYLRRATFQGNEAGYGGGICFFETEYSQAYIDDGTFVSNTAASQGGALYVDYPTYGGGAFSFSGNEVLSNTARDGDGGAIYVCDGSDYGGETYFDDNTFRNNVAGGSGGAFYISSDGSGLASEGALVSFSGNTLIGNVAQDGSGGAFCADCGLAYNGGTVLINDNWFEDNQASGEGGAFHADDLNSASASIQWGSSGEFNGNTIINNTSGEDGGGVRIEGVDEGSSLEFRDNVISGNVISSADAYDGGGVWFYKVDEGSVMWMTGNEINDNAATGDGGGLCWEDYVDYGSVLYFEDNALQRNRAGEEGGGCYFYAVDDGAAFFFNRNLVNDNVALEDGGGCLFSEEFWEANVVDLTGNEFNGNTAGGDYGGLYVSELHDGTVLRFWDNEVIGNRAGISGTQVLGGDGGGFWLDLVYYGSEADVRHNQILSNTAYLTGTDGGDYGGFYALLGNEDYLGLLTMEDNRIAGNEAQDSYGGMAVEMSHHSRLVMEHNVIAANTAVTEGGGLYIWGEKDSQYYLRRNEIVDNSAGAKGGLWIVNGDATDPLWGLSENNLVAGNVGSGIYLDGADYRSRNDTIAGNGAYGIKMGGAMTATAWLSNTIVWGNTQSFIPTHPATQTLEATFSDIQGAAVWPGAGNIKQNPLFAGAGTGDYHLTQASPAVNKVDPATAPAVDLDGIPRPVPVGGLADMGCYEWFRAAVTLAADQASTEAPGTVAVYELTATNDGNLADSFGLDVPVNDLGWKVVVSPASVDLAAGASAVVQVKVTVPAGAAGGTVNGLTVRATSKSDGTIIGTANIETTVANVADVGLAPNLAKSAAPGSVVRYEHTLTNNGNFADTITLAAISSQGWAASVLPAAATVPSGGSVPVVVRVTVPAGAPAGVVDVTTVKATSSASRGVTEDTATDTSTVPQVAGVEMGPDNSGTAGPATTATYSHVVTNTGNGADVFTVAAVSSQGWAVQVVPDTLNLGAGESGSVQVRVTVPAGAGGLTDVTAATATSAYNDTVSDSASNTTSVGTVVYFPLVSKNAR